MINIFEVNETNQMIEQENLDVRTITLGISLLDCGTGDLQETMDNIYKKITIILLKSAPFYCIMTTQEKHPFGGIAAAGWEQ